MLGENFSYCSLAVLPAALLRFDVAAAKSGVGVLVAVGAVLPVGDGPDLSLVGVELPGADVGGSFAGVDLPVAVRAAVGIPVGVGPDIDDLSLVVVELPAADFESSFAGVVRAAVDVCAAVGVRVAVGFDVGEQSVVGFLRLKFHEN